MVRLNDRKVSSLYLWVVLNTIFAWWCEGALCRLQVVFTDNFRQSLSGGSMTRHEAVFEFACVIDTVHAAAYTFPFGGGRAAVSLRNVFRNDLVKRLHLLVTLVLSI